MKTKEELNNLKNEIKTLNRKLAELTDEEMKEVTGGSYITHQQLAVYFCRDCGSYTVAPIKRSGCDKVQKCINCGSHNTCLYQVIEEDEEPYSFYVTNPD